ncbi:type I secretion system permease/ATPase [Thioclava sp. SK-1]|uniref:type I secretion system permease/ATPase n=1 Tax=Thioclava sp. SK-1 TaxID=1889770 RepID=UPI0021007516|nr:type I secretion system permease/ATPase [Thioclava sp. SK-1]
MSFPRVSLPDNERVTLISIGLFSAFVNLLMMTGPMFMLQVYDRVLPAHSVPSLTSLFLIVVFMFAILGLLEYSRSRLMARLAARFRMRNEETVFRAALAHEGGSVALNDLDQVQGLLSSRAALAIFDLPWSPLFFAAMFLFHPYLGVLALAGTGVLIGLALLARPLTKKSQAIANKAQTRAQHVSSSLQTEAELIRALGMQGNGFHRWHSARTEALQAELSTQDRSAVLSVTGRSLRHLLQAAILALGALVVLRGEMTAGAMIAGSILMGRALSPIEMIIGNWNQITRGYQAWQRIAPLLRTCTAKPMLPLPQPRADLSVKELSLVPPKGQAPVLRLVSFDLAPGQALGVIGPSGAGKTSLARALCGLWPPTTGQIRLDGAKLDRYGADQLGTYIGYLPQNVTLFDGTIAENIARLDPAATMEGIIDAAKRAAAHQMILDMPDGYETRVSLLGGQLSGGQVQRIGLARALYNNPILLVLDEPNSNLDAEGTEALNSAIRHMKAQEHAVIVMAHRPSGIMECEQLIMLDRGLCRASGPRDEVLAKTVRASRQDPALANIGPHRIRSATG